MMTPQQLLAKPITGSYFYSHSIGEYYYYRGTISNVKLTEPESDQNAISLRIEVTNVETMECDIDLIWDMRYRPFEIACNWLPYDAIEYLAPIRYVTIDEEPDGMRISFRETGVVYVADTNGA